MQFIIDGNDGFKVTEEKAVYKSKSGRATVHCPVEAGGKAKSLVALPTEGAKDFLTKFGINLQSVYDGKFAAFGKAVVKQLNDLDAKIDKEDVTFVKKAKKKRPSGAEVETFVKKLNKKLNDGCDEIAKKATTEYSKMVNGIVDAAYNKTAKNMGAAGKPILKQKLYFAFKLVTFSVIVIGITVAAIALPPLGIALGIAALVLKGLSATITLFDACYSFQKNYDKAVTKATTDIAAAEAAIDKAIAQMRLAKDSYTALEMNLGTAIVRLKEADGKAVSKDDDMVVKAKKKIGEAMAGIAKFSNELGNPDVALQEMESARAGIKKASGQIPDKAKKGSGSIGDLAAKTKEAISFMGEIVGLAK
jgi:low affinity Fe/Cu permease